MQQDPASGKRLAPLRIFLASAERDAGAAERALADLGDDTYGPDAIQFSRAFGEGQLARWKGDAAAAHASFTTARVAQQRIVDAQPDYGPALCVLGLIDAGLGRQEDALREGRRAVELTPLSKDRKSTRLNSSHGYISYAVFCLKKKHESSWTCRMGRLPPCPAGGALDAAVQPLTEPHLLDEDAATVRAVLGVLIHTYQAPCRR